MRVCAYPEFFWPEVFQDRGEASNVVLVGVGGYYYVQFRDTSAPEIGGDYIFAGVEGGAAGSAELEVASAVY